MNRFAYVCADRGVPLPGTKGSSNHVASVIRELVRRGMRGVVYAARATADTLERTPLRSLARLEPANGASEAAADFVYERYSLWHTRGLELTRRSGVPFLLEVNSPLPVEARRFRGLQAARDAERVAARLMRGADGIVCVSRAVASWVADLRGSDVHVWVVPNGVDPDLFAAAVPPRDPVIVFCGSFRPWHGLDDLAEAVALLAHGELPDVRLVCVGDGPGRAAFGQKLERLRVADRVSFSGAVEQAKVPELLGRARVAVAPYPALDDFYFSPLKLFEFMAMGLPVVAADLGQVREVLGGGARGVLYPPGDAGALARSLGELLCRPVEAAGLASAARRWVLMHATWRKRVDQILEHAAGLRPGIGASP